MCNKKERKRDRRWCLFPVSTLGAVILLFMVGRGGFFFPRRDGAAVFFPEVGRGGFFFFFRRDGTGRCFVFFRGPGRDGCFWGWQFFWRDGAKSLHRPAKGGLNRPASRPCKALKKMYGVPFLKIRCENGNYFLAQPVTPVAQRYHVTSDTLRREFDPGEHDFSH